MPPFSLRNLTRIAVFRALNLGDLLCAIPAMRALRAASPNAEIRLIGLPHMADFARRFSAYFDAFSSFPGAPGLPEQDFDGDIFIRFLQEERALGHDLVLQMHGKGSVTNPLVAMLGARHLAGYFEVGAFCPNAQTFMNYPEGLPEIRRHLELMRFLGAPLRGEGLEFPLADTDVAAAERLLAECSANGRKYVCIHPGARDTRRWWAPEKFARVADALADKGFLVLFTGSAHELELVEQVRGRMRSRSVNVAGRTELGALAALIGRSSLLVCNDTGVSHLAAAVATPSVVVFQASDPSRWAPLDRELHHAVLPEQAGDARTVILRTELALAAKATTRAAI